MRSKDKSSYTVHYLTIAEQSISPEKNTFSFGTCPCCKTDIVIYQEERHTLTMPYEFYVKMREEDKIYPHERFFS